VLDNPGMALITQGVDYAWGHPNYDALKRAGVKFAMRYISHDPGKDLTVGERDELWKRGIGVGLVYESTSGRALQGKAAGVADAEYARHRAAALGLAGIPIYFAVDFDANDKQKPLIANYFRGAVSVLGHDRVGDYGSYYVVRYLHDHNVCKWHWQTYAWSGGQLHPAAHIHQYRNGVSIAGLSCDLNHGVSNNGSIRHARPQPNAAKLKKWRRRLGLIRRVAKFVGWLPGLKRAANKLKRQIKAEEAKK
jgi:hypothetical protein